ncbi:restriction endonuclease subunit S [Streptomyces sp. NPDC127092]|uniref:restriction endonuclease subunit S n=1 Tax=Streptomyces sp. NPDC127092 TaxID=3347135 RepID=UPI0036546AB9
MTGTAVDVAEIRETGGAASGGGNSGMVSGGGESDLPKGWARATLGELGVEVQPGFASGKHNRDGNGVLHLRPMNITRHGVIDISDARFVEDESERRVQRGDVLFNNTNSPALVGKTAWVNSDEPLAYSNHMTRLRPPAGLDSRFLAIQLHTLWSTGHFRTVLNNHVNQASVSRKVLLDTTIAVPPLPEQHRIVAQLDEQLAHIEAGESSLARAANKLTELISQIRSQEIRTNPDKELPQEWRWGTVGDVLQRIEAGKSFTCLPRAAHEDEWAIIKVSAMTWGEFRADENKAVPEGREVNPVFEICNGDILLSRANTVEYVGAPVLVGPVRRKLLLSDKSLRLVPKDGVSREWLLEVLSSRYVREQYSDAATGTSDSMRNISQGVVKSARIPVPGSYDEQERIASAIREKIAQVGVLRDALDRQAAEVVNLRAALLHAAFTGTLVPQDPTDEPASALLDRIRAQRSSAASTKSTRRRTPRTSKSTGDPGQGELPL